jgi:dienelactone hydrolase
MDPERWQQIDALLEQALEASPEKRTAILDEACRGDADLRLALEKLLRAHERAGGFLGASALELAAQEMVREPATDLVGRTVAHYEVRSLLGAGGMGVVYLARDFKLDRAVALKFLPSYLSADETEKARFIREAKAASALDHPNIGTIYEIAETSDGQLFLAMAYYEGRTLKQEIEAGRLPPERAVDIASQIARGLAKAHERQITHRDIKPANILLTPDGVVKVIDFGLAKAAGLPRITRTHTTMGTVAYLSPEQARGGDADHRTDLWSLGVTLYEMLTGRLPFAAERPEAMMALILGAEPRPLRELRPDAPRGIERIVKRALEKRPEARYGSAAEMLKDLNECGATASPERSRKTRGAWLQLKRAAIPAFLALVVLGGWLGVEWRRQDKARAASETLLPEVARLAEQDRYAAAFALARQAEESIRGHPLLLKLWPAFSSPVSIRTSPADADVYMKEYDGVDVPWTRLGRSPLEKVRIPLGLLRWRVEKQGFATAEDVASGWGPIAFTLDSIDSVPAGMVRLRGAKAFQLQMAGFENAPRVELPDYWMDRHEVTNKQFKAFVDSGGYRNKDYWKHPFRKDGKTIQWEDAMAEFRDVTGRPGPSTWEAGDHPKGQEDYPVGGVSWYEAAAYAEFVGKSLPSVYHWNNAAITIQAIVSSYLLPLSNFTGRGPAVAGAYQGMSRSGTSDMAGNVKEWCRNEADGHKRYLLGGGWDEPAYTFHEADARLPFQRQPTFGFRCVKPIAREAAPEGLTAPLAPVTRNYAREQPVRDEIFRVYRGLYSYDKTPLHATVESSDESEPDWKREKVTFDAAYGKARMAAYLFLPRNSQPPYQTVIHFPGAESIVTRSSERLRDLARIDFLLKSGRAVVWPVYKGTFERGDDLKWYFPDGGTAYRDHVIQWSQDLARTIDYLETRLDIDRHALAYYGYSWGACLGAILPAVESRLKASVLMGAGFFFPKPRPEADQIHFAPRITIPTLMIDGRYDFLFPRESSQEPLYRLLGTPKEHKRLAHFDGGHFVPRHHLIRETLDWLDRYLGSVGKAGH